LKKINGIVNLIDFCYVALAAFLVGLGCKQCQAIEESKLRGKGITKKLYESPILFFIFLFFG
jgi:hypothetical protein